MATTYNWTDASIRGVSVPHTTTPRGFEPFILRNVIDTTWQTVATDNSIIQMLNVPAGTLVLAAWIRVQTAEGTGATDCNLGVTTTDPNRWGDALDLNATGVLGGALITAAPLYFHTADTIDLLSVSGGTALDSAIFIAEALCLDVGTAATLDAEGQAYAAQS